MEANEILKEVIEYLNERGKYQSFLDWAENRGFDVTDLEDDLNVALMDI